MSSFHVRYSFSHMEEYLDDDAKPEVLTGMSLPQSLVICLFGSTANLEVPEQNISSHADGGSDHDSAGHRSSHKISCCATPPTSKRATPLLPSLRPRLWGSYLMYHINILNTSMPS